MASHPEEIKLNMPWDFLDASPGISFDIGSSVIKTVYLHKDDWVEPEDRVKGSTGCVRVVKFAKGQLEEAFDYLKARLHVKRDSSDQCIDIDTTGIGSAEFNARIRETFNVKNAIHDEMTCFHHGFRHLLNHNPRGELLHELDQSIIQSARRHFEFTKKMAEVMKGKSAIEYADMSKDIYSFFDKTEDLSDQPLSADKDLFPCMLLLLGSGFASLMLNEDGTFKILDGSYRAGRMFLGLGALLTDVKSFDELIALCEKGDSSKVSSTTTIVFDTIDSGDSVYSAYKEHSQDAEEQTIFNFGQAVGKDIEDFKKEDLAMCLLETIASDAVQMGHNAASKHQVKHVFFCGSFASHPVARQVILKEWLKRHLTNASFSPKVHMCEPHFLKHGPYLGALGAYINCKVKFSDQKPA